MNTSSHESYYTHNRKYALFLDTQDTHNFLKYTDTLHAQTKKGDSILDVGCGTGLALEIIEQKGDRKAQGIDVAQTSIKSCIKKKLQSAVYDGKVIPFRSNSFHAVGSINTLEHTDNPIGFLDECIRVLKKNGTIIVACPNFLSVTNNYHYHTRGYMQKLKNLFGIGLRIFKRSPSFDKMQTIDREAFQPDDDACNVTNPQDILIWAQSRNLKLISLSSQQIYRDGLFGLIDRYPFNILLGSCFMVFQK